MLFSPFEPMTMREKRRLRMAQVSVRVLIMWRRSRVCRRSSSFVTLIFLFVYSGIPVFVYESRSKVWRYHLEMFITVVLIMMARQPYQKGGFDERVLWLSSLRMRRISEWMSEWMSKNRTVAPSRKELNQLKNGKTNIYQKKIDPWKLRKNARTSENDEAKI